jgi:hypothetical protein
VGGIANLGMMGVGFGRGGTSAGLPPELNNAFLALKPIIQGSMHPGYIVKKGGVVLGITPHNSGAYHWIHLARSASVPGDWTTEAGCFAFPALASSAFCGTMLVDTGISSMILALPKSQRPASLAAANPIPSGTTIRVTASTASGGAVRYQFSNGDLGPMSPVGGIRWALGTAFINTGRYLIAGYDYLYDAGSGRVGFKVAR